MRLATGFENIGDATTMAAMRPPSLFDAPLPPPMRAWAEFVADVFPAPLAYVADTVKTPFNPADWALFA